MSEINLLSTNNSSRSNTGQLILKVIVKILFAFLVLIILYYAWLLLTIRSTNASIAKSQNQIAQAQQEVEGQKDRQELIVRQGQLSALGALLNNHVYWSNLFPKLADATLKGAGYMSFSADDKGNGTMSVTVPNYSELDKFLQVFDLPQFSENFNNIRISNISRSQNGDQLETKAEIQFKYNGSLIKKTTQK